jgi:hypothetical protein
MNRLRFVIGLALTWGLLSAGGCWPQTGQAAGRGGAGATAPLVANTISVTSTGDGAAFAANCPGANCRLRDAIAAAASGDMITFNIPTSDAGYDATSGVYTIALSTVADNTFGPSALLIDKALTIDAGNSITLSRAGSAGTLRHFYVNSAGSLTLKGVRLTAGRAFEGGAIYNQGNVVATGVTFGQNNSINRGRGGALFNTGTGLFTATRTSFQGNQAEGVGGAIYNDSTNATPVSITESDLFNSYSIGYVLGGNTYRSDGHGGAIYNAGRLSVKRSHFGGNLSNYNGGAIYNVGSGNLTVSDSFFELNGPTPFSIGPFYGGAIRNDGILLVSGTTFYNNSAKNRGGAIFAFGAGSQTTLVNSTFSQNRANYGAAVIGNSSAPVGIYNCTFAENTGYYTLWAETGASVTVANSILFNPATQLEFGSFNGSFNLMNNIVRGSNPNPQLLPLGSYGGPQVGLTGFQNPMYGIAATSPAVDAGDNSKIPIDSSTNLPFATDQRGFARVDKGNPASPAAIVDIGAFEVPFVCPTITVSLQQINQCPEVANGQITVSNVQGSFGALQYSKDNGVTFQDSNVFTNLAAGNYTIVVKDANGCTSAAQMVTLSSAPTVVSLSKAQESFAAAGGTGSFTVNAIGGCSWQMVNNAPSFITLNTPAGGQGSGTMTVNYTVARHSDPSARRVGTLSVNGQSFTVQQGAAFLDVPESHGFYSFIGKLSAAGITQGCGDGKFCLDANVTRDQMAVFLSRALGVFTPPTPAAQRFADVKPTDPFYAFIEEIARRQITLGCDSSHYCPSDPVTRQAMAAFIIRALHEPGYVPPTNVPQRFNDVPSSNAFYGHIEELAVRGITLGCGGGNYCPTQSVTRAQMAAFLVRAFGL